MKKLVSWLLSFAVLASLLFVPKIDVYADVAVSLSVSASSLKVGESVTVTLSIPSGYCANGVLTCGGANIWDDSSDMPFTIGDAGGQPNSVSKTYTAVSPGSCTFTALVEVIGDENDSYPVVNPSASVTVENEPIEEPEEPKDNDNFLANIVLSNGTLSPAFLYTTMNYTAVVGNEVTSVAVSATTSSPKASIISLTGNSDLQVGENTVSIQVQAEDGTVRTYTIVITRQAASTPVDEEPDEEPDTPEDETDVDGEATTEEVTFLYESDTLVPLDKLPEDIPEGFESSTITLSGKEYPCITLGDFVTALFLVKEGNTEGKFYVWDENLDEVYPLVVLRTPSTFVVALVPNSKDYPDGLSLTKANVGENDVITAFYADDEFCYFLGVNRDGETYWYRYDTKEQTFQRYQFEKQEETQEVTEDTSANEELEAEYESLVIEYNAATDEFNDFQKKAKLAGGVALILIIVLLIAVLSLAISKHKRELDYDMELEDFDDSEEDENETEYEDEYKDSKHMSAEPVLPKVTKINPQEELNEPKLDEKAQKFDTVDLTKTAETICEPEGDLIREDSESIEEFVSDKKKAKKEKKKNRRKKGGDNPDEDDEIEFLDL